MPIHPNEKIEPVNVADEMSKSFLDYSMSVITRASGRKSRVETFLRPNSLRYARFRAPAESETQQMRQDRG
jgi:hypothetical protein